MRKTMNCKDKIPMTSEEEKQLNESLIKILIDGLSIVRERFPTIQDVIDNQKEPEPPKK